MSSISYCDICWVILTNESSRKSHFNSDGHLKTEVSKAQRDKMKTISPTYCNLCFKETGAKNQFEAHLKGNSHLKKLNDQKYISTYLKVKSSSYRSSSSDDEMDVEDDKLTSLRNVENIKLNDTQSTKFMHKSMTFNGIITDVVPSLQVQAALPRSASFTTPQIKLDCLGSCSLCYVIYTSDLHKQSHLNGKDHKKRYEVSKRIQESTVKEESVCKVCYTVSESASQLFAHLNGEVHKKQVLNKEKFCNLTEYDSVKNKNKEPVSELIEPAIKKLKILSPLPSNTLSFPSKCGSPNTSNSSNDEDELMINNSTGKVNFTINARIEAMMADQNVVKFDENSLSFANRIKSIESKEFEKQLHSIKESFHVLTELIENLTGKNKNIFM